MNRAAIAVLAAVLVGGQAFSAELREPLPAVSSASSTSVILGKVETANSSVRSLESGFSQTKTLKVSGKKIGSAGTLYFRNDGRLSMKYSKPAGELLVVNGNRFHMDRGGKAMTFDTSKNQMMGSLAKTLTGCIKGVPQQVAEDNGADISASETSEGYSVTLVSKGQVKRGYSRIELLYRKSDCVLMKMSMTEPSGTVTVYEMKDVKKNVSFPEDVFRIPSGRNSAQK